MDTIDRTNTNLPARYPPSSVPTPGSSTRTSRLSRQQLPRSQINPRVILRVLGRHWWRILALWLVVSAPIVFLIYMVIQPTYEAVSLLRIEPAVPEILGPLNKAVVQAKPRTQLISRLR